VRIPTNVIYVRHPQDKYRHLYAQFSEHASTFVGAFVMN
jgi:hypothetical protein